ncbi:hypothetical protein [Qipengyuania sp. MTN3-11]|uniref:hypothetical protein n=1 Tax=Qipengyuania sp. MTN3-11 TaxID=3056557 RepID=UPI0036F36F29
MTDDIYAIRDGSLKGWRIAGWGALLALLALPTVAYLFDPGFGWSGGDFLFAIVMLGALGIAGEVALRVGKGWIHRLALLGAAGAGFATVWINAAVGIIGEGAINIAYDLIVLAALIGSVAVRFRAWDMARVTALVIVAELITAIVAQLNGQADWGPALFAIALWLAPLLLFRKAASDAAG